MTPKCLTSAPRRTELPGVGVGKTGEERAGLGGSGPGRPLGGDAERAPEQGGCVCAEPCDVPPRFVPRTCGTQRRRRLCLPPATPDSNPNLRPLRCHRGWPPGPRAVRGGGGLGGTPPASALRAQRATGDSCLVESEACGAGRIWE